MRGGQDSAISDVIGNVLLVAITVGLTALFVLFIIAARPGPTDKLHADLAVEFEPVAATICDSETAITVTHGGGEALRLGTAKIVLEGGGTLSTFENADLETDPLLTPPLQPLDVYQSGFDLDGVMGIGERWVACVGFPPATDVTVTLIQKGGDAQVMQSSVLPSITTDCSSDAIGPTLTTLMHEDPLGDPDITVLTTGPIEVQATFTDNCAGVDVTAPMVDPVLHFFIGAIEPGAPPFTTDTGTRTMNYIGGTTWNTTIPPRNWVNHAGETLQLYVDGPDDEATPANAGSASAVATDLVDITGVTTCVFDYVDPPAFGTLPALEFEDIDITNDPACDGNGTRGTLTEEATTATAQSSTYDATACASGCGSGNSWTSDATNNAFASDDLPATNANNNPADLRSSLANEAGSLGTVLSVVLRAEVSIAGYIDDAFQLQGCGDTGCTNFTVDKLGPFTSDTVISYNITAQSAAVGGGAWSAAEINALELVVRPVKVGGGSGRDGTWEVDHAYVEVKYRASAGHVLDAQLNFINGPDPTSMRVLEFEYRVLGDTFTLEIVGTGTNPCPTLTSITVAKVQCALSVADYNGGIFSIRLVDVTAGNASPAILDFDYIRVITA